MPFTAAVEVLKPLLAARVPTGRVTSRVAPALVVIAPTVRASGFAVALAFRTMTLAPLFNVRPAKVWAFVVLALPVRVSVPPPSESALVAARMFVAGVAAEKSRVKPPRLTAVAPVKVLAPARVSVPVPILVTEPRPEMTPR